MTKISFPQLDKESNVRLCFLKKSRQDDATTYKFFETQISEKVKEKLWKWIEKNVAKVNNKDLDEYNPSNNDNMQYIKLDAVETWHNLRDPIISISFENFGSLKKIKDNLSAVIVYAHIKGTYWGYIRRVTKSHILESEGMWNLVFSEGAFSDLVQQKGIKMDDYADVVFSIGTDKEEAAIISKKNFEAIFDMRQQIETKSLETIKNLPVLKDHPQMSEISKITKEDRTIQKMLANPLVQVYGGDCDIETLKKHKEEIGNKVLFEIDGEKKIIVFPHNVQSAAIKDLIRVITKHFRSLNNKYILEGSASKVVK